MAGSTTDAAIATGAQRVRSVRVIIDTQRSINYPRSHPLPGSPKHPLFLFDLSCQVKDRTREITDEMKPKCREIALMCSYVVPRDFVL